MTNFVGEGQGSWPTGSTGPGTVLKSGRYRLTMGDVDAAGVVYYANPYRWRDAIYHEWLNDVGMPASSILSSRNGLPCVRSSAEYNIALRLDDIVELALFVERVGTSSFDLRMDVVTDERLVAISVRTTQVWVSRAESGAADAEPLPAPLREALTGRCD